MNERFFGAIAEIAEQVQSFLPAWTFTFFELLRLYEKDNYKEMEERFGVPITKPPGQKKHIPSEINRLLIVYSIFNVEKEAWLEGKQHSEIPWQVENALFLEAEWRAQLIVDSQPLPEDKARV